MLLTALVPVSATDSFHTGTAVLTQTLHKGVVHHIVHDHAGLTFIMMGKEKAVFAICGLLDMMTSYLIFRKGSGLCLCRKGLVETEQPNHVLDFCFFYIA